eukprot:755922-Hanusia_phi.AAC.2
MTLCCPRPLATSQLLKTFPHHKFLGEESVPPGSAASSKVEWDVLSGVPTPRLRLSSTSSARSGSGSLTP